MKVEYLVKIHFDGAAAMSYDRLRPEIDDYPDQLASWWDERLAILENGVFPSLEAQTFQDFKVWGLFCQRTQRLSGGILRSFQDRGYPTSFDTPAVIMQAYQDKCDYLVMVHLDSDDLYAPMALEYVAEQEVSDGLVMYFEDGYIHSLADGRLCEFVTSCEDVGPPPYFAKVYTRDSLASMESWDAYRKEYRLHKVHYELRSCPNRVELPPWQFMGLLHDANDSRDWENGNTAKRVGREIEGRERVVTLEKFGL